MATVNIKQLSIETIIGAYRWERQCKQKLLLDLSFEYDINKAAVSDALEDAIDYAAVAESATKFVNGSSFQLIEALASQLLEYLQKEFEIKQIQLTVTKPAAIKNAKGVSITV